MIAAALLERLGDTDCEAIRDGLLAQPVNSLSSLGFLLIGGWLVRREWRREPGGRAYPIVFGVVLVSVGVGSVMFHGPQGPGSKWLHDASIGWALLLVAFYDLALARGWDARRGIQSYGGAAAGLGVLMLVFPGAGETIVWVLVLAVIGAELYLRRSVPSPSGWKAAYLVAAAVVIAGLAFFLGRTGSPWCDPESLIQLHGMWHLSSAVAAGAWAVASVDRQVRPIGPGR